MTRLAAIYNVWLDSVELLPYSVASVAPHVDLIVFVYQTTSNFGEPGDPLSEIKAVIAVHPSVHFELYHFTPISRAGAENETLKRKIGVDIAEFHDCTHFLHMDCDEVYSDFKDIKTAYMASGHEGSVLQMYTYFRYPTLRFENPDNYYVPFIHKLRPDTVIGMQSYPFYVDPTRRVNCKDVILIPGYFMHHFSYVRSDIQRKLRNSSARDNIAKSSVLQDYNNAHAGMFVKDFFEQMLVEVRNQFNIAM